MMNKMIIPLCLVLLLFGCGENPPEPSASDLMLALGLRYFEVSLPPETKPTDMIATAFRYADGTIKKRSGSSGFDPSEPARVFFFWDSDGESRLSIIRPNGTTRSTLRLEDVVSVGYNPKSSLELGDWLVRFTLGDEMMLDDLPSGDNFDLVLIREPRSGPGEGGNSEHHGVPERHQ